jgi:hypothetical protein
MAFLTAFHQNKLAILGVAPVILSSCAANSSGVPLPVVAAKGSTMDLKMVRQHVDAASVANDQRRFADSIAQSRAAIKAMGDTYRSANQIDDTGMKLTLAEAEAAKGNMETAAAMLLRVAKVRAELVQLKEPAAR